MRLYSIEDAVRTSARSVVGKVGSAVLVAILFRTTDIAPMLPRPILAVGSIFCFAVATLARLGWGHPPAGPSSSVERLSQRLMQVLYWIGMCWAALAIL